MLPTPRFQFTHPGRGATSSSSLLPLPKRSFNSRTPGGVRHIQGNSMPADSVFQFTHPGRGATAVARGVSEDRRFQFTHPGRGATDGSVNLETSEAGFQFTHPGRGATWSVSANYPSQGVSIHAPREGCDDTIRYSITLPPSFNSRTPGGVRQGRH